MLIIKPGSVTLLDERGERPITLKNFSESAQKSSKQSSKQSVQRSVPESAKDKQR